MTLSEGFSQHVFVIFMKTLDQPTTSIYGHANEGEEAPQRRMQTGGKWKTNDKKNRIKHVMIVISKVAELTGSLQ